MTREQFLVGLKQGAQIVAQVATILSAAGVPIAGAAATGIKIALGVAEQIPEAVAAYDRIKSGDIPTQAELDAWSIEEDTAYAKLMADIAAEEARQAGA